MTAAGDDRTDAAAYCRGIYPRLVGFLALQGLERQAAEDLAQETLARVWQRWPEVARMDAPDGWSFRVALNLSTSRWRRVAAERRAHTRLRGARPPSSPDATDHLAVRAAVAALPRRQRAAVVLRYFADLSVDDTAAAMSCAPGTVKALTSDGVRNLRAALSIQEEDHRDRAR